MSDSLRAEGTEVHVSDDLSGLTFEQLLERLEGITRRMAAGDIGIEAVTAMASYSPRGVAPNASHVSMLAVQPMERRFARAISASPACSSMERTRPASSDRQAHR